MCQAPTGGQRCGCPPPEPVPLGGSQPKMAEARDAAQQFFEASVERYRGNAIGKAIYVTGCLDKWPWLRPNRWMEEP